MIDRVVQYLKKEQVAFRLISFPMPEPLPSVAFALKQHARMVETRLALVGGTIAVVCAAEGERIDLDELAREVDAPALDTEADALPAPFTNASSPIPPLGGLLGVPLFVDARVPNGLIVFPAFAPRDFIEMAYDDFALLERPRIATFAVAGALPSHAEPAAPLPK